MTAIGDVLASRYELVDLLGRGGMSDVYLALDQRSGNQVALKIVRSGDPEFVRRLAQEVRALESFEHPGLIRLLDTGRQADQAFLVMEFVDGTTLAQSLQRGPLGGPETARLGERLADALAYVHERGIVHRDVKPSNILLSNSGGAWLGDFGIALHHDATTMTSHGSTVGTVVYMAPEQLEGHAVGPGADIWSLGMVLLECLTGERVFVGSPSEIVAQRLAGPVELPRDLPAPWKMLLSGMLLSRPDGRLSGGQVAALLASEPFAQPWMPSSDSTHRMAVVTPDATSRMPAAAAGLGLGTGAATARRGGQVSSASSRGDPALITAVRSRREIRDPRRWWIGPWALLILALLVVGAVVWLGDGSSKPLPATTTKPPVTTTTVAKLSPALANLLTDVAIGQATGNISVPLAQTITQVAKLAASSPTSGPSPPAQGYLQQLATLIATAQPSGLVSPGEATLLQHDLRALAIALGLSPPSATTTTTTTTTTPAFAPGPGQGPGPGHGKGHGKGN